MSTQQGAREFVILDEVSRCGMFRQIAFLDGTDDYTVKEFREKYKTVHVIERAAYDRLTAENAKLRELVKQAEKILYDRWLKAKKDAGIE